MGLWMARMGTDEELERKLSDKELLARIVRLLSPFKKKLFLIFVLLLAGSVTSILGPYITSQIIDIYLPKADIDGLFHMVLLFIFVSILDWLITSYRTYIITNLGNDFIYNLRKMLFNKLHSLSMRFFVNHQIGWLISRVLSDVDVVNNVLATGLVTAISDLVTIVAIAAFMIYLDYQLALISFIILPVLAIVTYYYGAKAREAFRKTRRKISALTSNVEQSLTGVRVIQAFNKEKEQINKFEQVNKEYASSEIEAARITAGFMPVVNVVQTFGTMLVLYFGGLKVINGTSEIGIVFAFVQYITRFFFPIREIAMLYNNFQVAAASAERIFAILEAEPEIVDSEDAIELPEQIRGEISYENVSFAYEPGVYVLKNINLTVRPGEKLAIVGATGAGKSTLAALTVRFYDPTEGVIRLDGIDLRKIKQKSLRKKVILVPQEPFVFSGTLMDNLKYANPEVPDEEVIRVCKEIGLHNVIEKFPNGYNTQISEGGIDISSGQKQLITIARAILANPSVVILDEAMSSVDPSTEEVVHEALKKLTKNRTTIIIAHRLSTVKESDRIIVMASGQIVQQGTHEQLLKEEGIYRNLWKTLVGAEQEVEVR
ncbi:MAG: ABC transporter ATP-binding protein [Thaumarchaeota archaeon]|nr:ABC transporter ATP-binding protein [Nitrososphaerota archaeon]